MRKTLVVAAREYQAAVRTKTFLITLVAMPLLMGGSVLVQWLTKDIGSTKKKHFAVVDRTRGAWVAPRLKEFLAAARPDLVLEVVPPSAGGEAEAKEQRFALSQRVRRGELIGFMEIGPKVLTPTLPAKDDTLPDAVSVRYQSDQLTAIQVQRVIEAKVNDLVQEARAVAAGLTPSKWPDVRTPVPVKSRGLTRRDARGELEDASEQSRIASFGVPFGMMMLLFMVLMISATPLMQGVVEEKMQRIAEVLLGSVRPFELMMGKLLGMTGVSLTIAAVYLGGAYWAATHFGFGDYVPAGLLAWFVVFQALATLMYGSLFIGIGAACSDMKETQNMMWPVMILVMVPLFFLGPVLQEPSSPLATGLSFFPFATPMLMLARQAVPPGVPVWQPLAGAVIVLVTTVLCVWAAGRVFRVGILMQGKGARVSDLVRWVFRG